MNNYFSFGEVKGFCHRSADIPCSYKHVPDTRGKKGTVQGNGFLDKLTFARIFQDMF